MERKEEERKRLHEELEREENNSGKSEVEGGRERIEIKRRCLDRVSSEVFDDFGSISEVESYEDSCVPAVPPSVPAVTVPFSNVDVDVVCEAVISDSDCEFVEPQTISLSRTNAKQV